MRTMPEFCYSDLLPIGEDATEYRQLTSEGITTRHAFGRDFLEVEPAVLSQLTETAMGDIAHLLRPGHLRQLRSILDDPEVRDFPAFIVVDDKGNDFFADVTVARQPLLTIGGPR
jgi:fumarate hydratase, class I